MSLAQASVEERDNEDMVLVAVQQDGDALKVASKRNPYGRI
jgi:hypothetical protein